MRVTAHTFYNSLLEQLNQLVARQTTAQGRVASGLRFQTPGEDPGAMGQVLTLQTDGQAVAQYQSNINTLQDQTDAIGKALSSLKQITDRARELATSADGTKSAQDLQSIAIEVSQLIQQGVGLVNTQFQGQSLFAGTITNAAPFSFTTDSSGFVSAVSYAGNDQVTAAQIGPSDTISVQVPGVNNSNSGPRGLIADSRTGTNLFQHLIDLQNDLRNGDVAKIANIDQANLGRDEDNLLYHVANNGAQQARLTAAQAQLTSQTTNLQQAISNQSDADLAQTIIQLNQTQNAYQAALQSGALMLKQSLLDFLR